MLRAISSKALRLQRGIATLPAPQTNPEVYYTGVSVTFKMFPNE